MCAQGVVEGSKAFFFSFWNFARLAQNTWEQIRGDCIRVPALAFYTA